MTYPFTGEIKMETIKDEDGNDKVVWDEVKVECGPYYVNNKPQVVMWSGPTTTDWIGYGHGPSEWARLDKDLNLLHLDMDLCAKGPANAWTALAVGIWNAAIEKAAEDFELGDDYYYDEVRESILRLKK